MVNKFFQAGRGIGSREEQNLLQSLVNESIQIAGADFLYLPRSIVKLDQLYREDYLSEFTRNHTIEMFIENFDGFQGDGELIGQFGFSMGDRLRLNVSKERFQYVTNMEFPKEGDLVYYPTGRMLFELKFLDDKTPLYPLGARQYYSLNCELFRYSNENITTGTEADEVTSTFGNDGTIINDPFANNTNIKNKGYEVVSFSENNPFGTP
jgi:hypothetical protein